MNKVLKGRKCNDCGYEDFKKIQINFDYERKRKNNGFTYNVLSIYLPLFCTKTYPKIQRESCEKSTQEHMKDLQRFLLRIIQPIVGDALQLLI